MNEKTTGKSTYPIKVHEGDEAIVVSGKDVQSGKIYVILVKVK